MSLNKYMGIIAVATLAIVAYSVFFAGSKTEEKTAEFLGMR